MTDDVYDVEVDMDELPTFRLFFFNKECDECPMHLYDFKTEEWEPTGLKPKSGDRAIKDGTEMVCLGGNSYRELGKHEEPVWDFSEPEAAMIEKVEYRRSEYADRRSDPHIDPSNMIQPLRHF